MRDNGSRPEIERALRFIAENLETPLTVADVAGAAHLSEFHFHRMFHAIVGEPIGRFVMRRRLELAALRLAYEPDRKITDIALSSGYSSTSNFSKAFSAFFGCSPSEVRDPSTNLPAPIGRLTTVYKKAFRPADLYVLPPKMGTEERRHRAAEWGRLVRFETVGELSFACLASPGGYELAPAEQTWAELIELGRQLGFCGDVVDAWGMAHDSPNLTSVEFCRYHACAPCPQDLALPAPLFRGQRREGRYAVFPYSGSVPGVEQAYRSIYSCWFPSSAVAPDDFIPLDHYVTDEPIAGYIELEMWFKVRPRR